LIDLTQAPRPTY